MKKIIRHIIIFILVTLISAGCSRSLKKKEHTNGRFVFYSMRDKGNGLFLYRDGELKFLHGKTGLGVWSPDGKSIAS